MQASLGNVKFFGGCCLRVLDETVQQNDVLVHHCEQNSGDLVRKVNTNLPQVFCHLADQGHPQWPAKLHRLNILAYRASFAGWQ